jgi:RNA 2',3'-cyclic 3'-phosphodiesterase
VTPTASFDPDERIRLFCALRIGNDVLGRLASWQHAVFGELGSIRIVPPENVHVTLAFLGRTPARELDDVASCLRAAALRAARPLLRVGRYRETRSVGMLVLDDEDERAAALARDLHGRLEALGVYERERREWLPHLTVTRFRRAPRLRPALPDLGDIGPSEAAVYHSVLRRGGAQYEVLESVPLGGG